MKIVKADNCGFCPGVRNAIRMAEEVLDTRQDVYSLGPIIHNKDMVDRLAAKGLKTVNSADRIPGGTVIIRSHGAAPDEIQKLKNRGLQIIDATCVLVKRVQHLAQQLEKEGYRVVVIGDKNHPEVKAVVGCVEHVTVIADDKDIANLPSGKKLGVICQTTQSPAHFGDMVGAICRAGFNELKVVNTLCREAIKRQKSAVQVCQQVDVMFVLGGLESANTRKLAELCKKFNPQTFHLQNWQEFDKKQVFGKTSAGVTAGASTPDWIIEEFIRHLSQMN